MQWKLRRYWAFQLGGWGLFGLINIFFNYFYTRQLSMDHLVRVFFFIEIGILTSHAMRSVIQRNVIMFRAINRQLVLLFFLTVIFGSFFSIAQTSFERTFGWYPINRYKPFDVHFFYNFFSTFLILFMWNCFYFMYHYVAKSRKQQMDTLQLEALVKSLELKTIKAHINPHFIFNSLNGIRALIDEDPSRARKAITELSNILRSSLSQEKNETVMLREELKIVRDYLALENMRFEDRLKVDFEIDDDTLSLQVPPMMLQTLVENAIKHGISKRISGGTIRIISDIRDNYHELAVQNTGHLNGGINKDGFGLSSTHDRLGLIYGAKAKFEIEQLQPEMVQARVLIPVTLN